MLSQFSNKNLWPKLYCLSQNMIKNDIRLMSFSYLKYAKAQEDSSTTIDVQVEDAKIEDLDEIEKMRNKSGLSDNHQRIINHKAPINSLAEKETMPLWLYRKLYGRYGAESGIDFKCLWPSELEMSLAREREAKEFPNTAQEMIQMARDEKMQKEKAIMDRQNELKEKLKQLDTWKEGVRARMAKKEEIARIALEKKQREIEEVRETLGYSISPFDPKFQEIIEQRQEEEKKRKKKEKKLRKEQMILQKLIEIADEDPPKKTKESESTESATKSSEAVSDKSKP